MKNLLFLFSVLWFSNAWGLSLSCPQREMPQVTFPAKQVKWVIDHGSDGVDGLTFKVPETIDSLDFLSANLLIAGVTEADYLVPLKVDIQTETVKASFYAPKQQIGNVTIKLIYGDKSDLCGSKNVMYFLSYAGQKT